VGLLLTGFALAIFGSAPPKVGLNAHTLTTLLLPPLIFEGALNIRWSDLRRDLPVIVALTTVGVLLACSVVAGIMRFLGGWSWQEALLFGALIAATDPIAVLASFKHAKIGGRPRLLLEAESLLNDGTAVVLYTLLGAAFAHHGAQTGPFPMALSTLFIVGGSLICGLAVGGVLTLLAGRAADGLTETTLTMVAAYGAYYLAERIHGTGILASLAAGLVMGNIGMAGDRFVTERGRKIAEAFWEFAAFIANSLVFLLMGMYLARVRHSIVWNIVVVAVAAALAGRAVTVYGIGSFFRAGSDRLSMNLKHLLFWGGQRGGLSLVLAIGLAAQSGSSAAGLITAAAAVVTFSVLVQGLTFNPLLRKVGLLSKDRQAA
jgi:CPA1 family monovalent cation:H+ antiporter